MSNQQRWFVFQIEAESTTERTTRSITAGQSSAAAVVNSTLHARVCNRLNRMMSADRSLKAITTMCEIETITRCTFPFRDENDNASNNDADMIESLHLLLKKQDDQTDYEEYITPFDPISNMMESNDRKGAAAFDDNEPSEVVKMMTDVVPTPEPAANVEQELRRGVRRRTPNSRYTKDYISPAISPLLKRAATSKRRISPSVNTAQVASKPPKPLSKKKKTDRNSPSKPLTKPSAGNKSLLPIVTVGDFKMSWPRYGIEKITIHGKSCSITNTCPLDTGLFIYYHAFMISSAEFRRIFEKDTLDIFAIFRQTIHLAIEDGWDHARAYWVSKHDLLPKRNSSDVYDLTNTLTEIVFRFLQPIQEYTIKSECSCSSCPRKIRQTSSVDLVLTYV